MFGVGVHRVYNGRIFFPYKVEVYAIVDIHIYVCRE